MSGAKPTNSGNLVSFSRRYLPMTVRARPALLHRFRQHSLAVSSATTLFVTNIYDGGRAGLLCAIKLDPTVLTPALVTSVDEVAFDRKHPFAAAIRAYQKCRK
jgi:hypothetical protein